jgi:hypothetical protein
VNECASVLLTLLSSFPTDLKMLSPYTWKVRSCLHKSIIFLLNLKTSLDHIVFLSSFLYFSLLIFRPCFLPNEKAAHLPFMLKNKIALVNMV